VGTSSFSTPPPFQHSATRDNGLSKAWKPAGYALLKTTPNEKLPTVPLFGERLTANKNTKERQNMREATPNEQNDTATAAGGSGQQRQARADNPAIISPPQAGGILANAAQRPLVPRGGNDRIFTPDALAVDIVRHFMPSGRVLEPCAGGGAFLRALPKGADWYEIDLDRDFLAAQGHWDWLITNPPYSLFRAFLQKSMQVADNIVFLCLDNAWNMRARRRDLRRAGFGIVEMCECPVPPPPWPQFGMCLGATWIRRGWQGSTRITELPSGLWRQWAKRPGRQGGGDTVAFVA